MIAPVIGIRAELDARDARRDAQGPADNPGAAVLGAHPVAVPRGALPAPDPASLPDDWFTLPDGRTGRVAPSPALADSCSMGGSTADGAPVLVVVGDSRARQFAPSLMTTARAQGWTVVALWAPGCPLATGEFLREECQARNGQVLDYLHALRPTAVALETTQVPWEGKEVPMQGTTDITASACCPRAST